MDRSERERRVGEILSEYTAQVDPEMRRLIDARTPVGTVYDMMRYHLGWVDATFREDPGLRRGKRFRPAMLLLACEALGGTRDRALPAAAAVELVHNFSLIHDDIEDGDETRRGRPTLWSLWGRNQGINTGDGMHALVNLAALELPARGVDAATTLDVLRVLDAAVLELCEGQYLDLVNEERDVGVAEYLTVIEKKTSALIAAATHCGAILATDDAATRGTFARFGRTLGLAFQIRDDILGAFHPENLGKDGSSDILRKKRNLPVLLGLERSPEADRIREVYAKAELTAKDVDEVVRILRECGADSVCMDLAGKYEAEAFALLERARQKNAAFDRLVEVSEFLVWREH